MIRIIHPHEDVESSHQSQQKDIFHLHPMIQDAVDEWHHVEGPSPSVSRGYDYDSDKVYVSFDWDD